MDSWLIIVLLIAIALFIVAVVENRKMSYRPYPGGVYGEGNGKYQYKGRGYKKESVAELLSRIDWLAANSSNKSVYTTAYIMAFPISLAVLVLLYAYNKYCMSAIEYILILIVIYTVIFSITNLIDFHNDRYSIYYIRNNIKYIADKLDVDIDEPKHPHPKSCVPHRTIIKDTISY